MNSAASISYSSEPLTCRLVQLFLYSAMALATVSSGCGKVSNKVRVTGKVTYHDDPISTGLVTFFPASGRPTPTTLSPAGDFTVDLAPGEYTVTVNVASQPPPPGYEEGDPLPPPKIVLPPEYTTQARSKLAAIVTEQNQQSIEFNLE
jgi:hypothetical protein